MVVTFATGIGSEFKKPKMSKAQWKGIKEIKAKVEPKSVSLPSAFQVSMTHNYPVSFIRSSRHTLIQELED